ncbi:hypothetical protein LOTGIDRAFT_228532 [Lottia gigantea]|uniref:Uncharacterized protein n=1 Tax=Lottia gigantea TaxID=225164 RepID=V4BXD3_LOTGI|nr:hypothetical protein LOTGIDRAFT_228532 [Lottia gigantea]ESO93754.1 hypothetical protein LOTGIDRAFT_228532 [Lottia gigantea]
MALWSLFTLIGVSLAFDLNDPKTNLDSVIRTTGSTDPNIQTVNYINGTIFLRFPGGTLQKVFLLEGFNIARKVPKSFGYLSLSKEFLVYRNYKTGEIIDVLMNPQTRIPNEVFYIHNDPVNVNFTYGQITPFTILENDRVGFNNDILLQYPNVLDPQHYPKYTAGPIYEADELFQFYTRYSKLATTNIQDLNYTSTWSRRSQFLPWLELGGINGHMYYVSTNWKCLQGFADVPQDILDIVKNKFPDFLNAPDTFEVPNETTWSAFKAVIDQRRKEGKPDIIIPEVNIKQGLRNKPTHLDPLIYETLAKLDSFTVTFTGRVYSEITGNNPINLFKVKGILTCKVNLTPGGPQIVATIKGNFLDPNTDQVLTMWKNPLTNQTNYVPPISGKYGKTLFKGDDSVWSLPVPKLEETAVVGATSRSFFNNATGTEDWSVQLLDVFFPNEDLKSMNPYMYGTWIKYSSWPEWMGMTGDEGLLVWRMNLELLKSKTKYKGKSIIG